MMGVFETSGPASGGVVEIRLECISKVDGTDGLWWVAEGHADGTTNPRGLFNGREEAAELAAELAESFGVPVVEKSHAA